MGVIRLNEEQLELAEKILEKLDHMSEILDRMLQNPKKVQEPLVQCYDHEDEEEEAAETVEDSVEDTAKEKNNTIEVEEIIELPTETKSKEITLLRLDLVVPESERVKKTLEEQALPKVRLTKIDVEGANGDLVGILQLQSRAQGRSFNGALHPPRPANPFDEEEVNPFSKGSATPGSKPRSPTLESETFADTDPKLILHSPSDFPLDVSSDVKIRRDGTFDLGWSQEPYHQDEPHQQGKVGPRLVWQPPWKFSMDLNDNFGDSLSRESEFAKDKLVVEESNGDKEENPGRLSRIRKRSERLICEKRCSSGLIALQVESGKLEHRMVMGSNLYSSAKRKGIATVSSGIGFIPQLSLSLALFSYHNPILKDKRGIKEVSQFDVSVAVISNSLSFSWLVGCDSGRVLLAFRWIQWMNFGYGRVMGCLVDARELFVAVVHGMGLHEFFRWIEKIELVHGLICNDICDSAFGWRNFDEEGNELAEKCKGKKFVAHYLFDILPLKLVFEPFDRGWKGNLVGIDCDGVGVMKYEIPDPYVEHAGEENNGQCSYKRSLDIRLHTVSILELWAVGAGKTLNTIAFQNASVYLKSCADKGGVFVYLEYRKRISSLNGLVNAAHHPLSSPLNYGNLLQMVESINTNIAFGTSENTRVVIDHGAIPIFIKLLEFPSDDVHEQAVLALGNVAGDSLKCCDIVLSHGVLMPLLAQFNDPTKLSMMRNGMWTLSDFCRCKPPPAFDQTRLSIPALGRLIHSIDEEVLTDACWHYRIFQMAPTIKSKQLLTQGLPLTH